MFEVFKSNSDFCNAPIKLWIIILACSCLVILVWGIYQYEVEPEVFTEKMNHQISDDTPVLTYFPSTEQTFRTPGPQQEQRQYQAHFSISSKAGDGMSSGNFLHYIEGAFKQAIASVRPSVVNIKSIRMDGSANQNGAYESVGSGLIVSTRGHILTNYHVIANSKSIVISPYGGNGKRYNAWILDHHVDTDLTLLKLDTEDIFTPAILGDSDRVETGDLVLAIGSPFGMDQTVTSGIVSGLGKTLTIESVTYENMIQTDAPINRGSSGGPLVNIDGEVIGVNTAIYAPTGVFSGTAFAMPINRIKRFLAAHNLLPGEGLMQASYTDSLSTIQGWLGVEIQSVDRTIALHLGLPYIGGVLVNRVGKNSPALKNGMKRGDVILEIDGKEIIDIDTFESLIADKKPEEAVKLLVLRDKQLKEFFVTLSQFPS